MSDTTNLLENWAAGDVQAFDTLYGRLYDSVRHLARQVTGLPIGAGSTVMVHDLYLKIRKSEGGRPMSREHFFAFMRKSMSRYLIDEARARRTTVAPEDLQLVSRYELSTAMRDALLDLKKLSDFQVEIFQLKGVLGMTTEEVVEHTGHDMHKVNRAWQAAKAYMALRLKREGE